MPKIKCPDANVVGLIFCEISKDGHSVHNFYFMYVYVCMYVCMYVFIKSSIGIYVPYEYSHFTSLNSKKIKERTCIYLNIHLYTCISE